MSGIPIPSNVQNLKTSESVSSLNAHKQRAYLPSRYAQQRIKHKVDHCNVLTTIETNMKSAELDKTPYISRKKVANSPQGTRKANKITIDGSNSKLTKESLFKSKPLRKEESEMQNFQEIFIQPRQQFLKKIKLTCKESLNHRTINEEYDKLLYIQNGNVVISSQQPGSPTRAIKRQFDKIDEIKDSQVNDHFKQCMSLLQDEPTGGHEGVQDHFYDEQIRVEAPQLPNSSTASSLTPGSGYAPSIPLNASNLTKQSSNLRQLLMRAKAGMNSEDIQKQAHLSFFLGGVYQQRRNYTSALRFYSRFLGFAKAMQDKIGMALGSNRVAVNYYDLGITEKSIAFHNQNLKLSDNQNCFAGFYNLGICYRKLGQYQQSLEHFQTALQWATHKGELDSECITIGQMAVTHRAMGLYQEALKYFEKSLDLCNRLNKTKLKLNNLRNVISIISKPELKYSYNMLDICYQSYECAKTLQIKSLVEIFGCNIGILKGISHLEQRRNYEVENSTPDVQEIDDKYNQED